MVRLQMKYLKGSKSISLIEKDDELVNKLKHFFF